LGIFPNSLLPQYPNPSFLMPRYPFSAISLGRFTMDITFETPHVSFQARFSGAVGTKVAALLPIETVLNQGDRSVFFAAPAQTSLGGPAMHSVAAGDVAYSLTHNRFYIFYESFEFGPVPSSMIYLGAVLSLPQELKTIQNGEKIKVFPVKDLLARFSGDRILSQSEIDTLIKGIKK